MYYVAKIFFRDRLLTKSLKILPCNEVKTGPLGGDYLQSRKPVNEWNTDRSHKRWRVKAKKYSRQQQPLRNNLAKSIEISSAPLSPPDRGKTFHLRLVLPYPSFVSLRKCLLTAKRFFFVITKRRRRQIIIIQQKSTALLTLITWIIGRSVGKANEGHDMIS